jgi:sterol desaturase/sphingolipid hydroxylase (fatty acid hydroxylase superfamily)
MRFAADRVSAELFSPGSIFSVYSLATSIGLGFAALVWRLRRRRGRFAPGVVARAAFSPHRLAFFLKGESLHADVKLFALSVVLMPVVVGALVISLHAVAVAVNGALTGAFGARPPIDAGQTTIKLFSTVVLFLAYEIGYFADHWLKHRVPFLWELHKLHHTADALTPLVNFRNHPIDNIVFGYMLAFFIGGATGLLDWLYGRDVEFYAVGGKNILFLAFLWTIGHLQHSQFWIPFRGVWGRLFLSPAHHQIHHSKDPAHYNRNLGSVLAVWDWMAGTLEIPTRENPRLAFGVDEPGVNPHSSYAILVAPALGAALALARLPLAAGRALLSAFRPAPDGAPQGRG